MLLANHDGNRVYPVKGLIGNCPFCGGDVIPVCGDRVTHHWRHKTNQECDGWWEETPWHLGWKRCFPEAWWEKLQYAEDGEKHVADVKMPAGLVLEFQHSPISIEERLSRERFYKGMIWIVDGSRLKRPYTRFARAMPNWKHWRLGQGQAVEQAELVFPAEWSDRPVPVVFDWGVEGSDLLVWLDPLTSENRERQCFKLDRDGFVKMMIKLNLPTPIGTQKKRPIATRPSRRL